MDDRWYTGIKWIRARQGERRYVIFVSVCSLIEALVELLSLGSRTLTLRSWALFNRPADWFEKEA